MKIEINSFENNHFLKKMNREYKFIVIWCKSGNITIDIDNAIHNLAKNQIVTISPKQFWEIKSIKKAEGNILVIDYDFFCRDNKSTELIFYNGLFCHFGDNEIITLFSEMEIDNLVLFYSKIVEELKVDKFEANEKLFSLTKLIIIELSRIKLAQQNGPLYAPDTVFLNFLNTARENFSSRLSVKELALKIGSTENKINELAKIIADDTAKNLLNDLIVLEAKRYLNYEKMRINEVAYKLGFSDPFYFSRFFKKQTSQSPRNYIKERELV